MKPADRTPLSLAVAIGLLSLCAAAQAQPDTQPPTATPAAPDTPAPPNPATPPADARDALKKQAGDVDQATLLKDTLTKTDRQYSLLRAGRAAVNYNLNYSYIGSESIDTGYDTTGAIDLFKIVNTRSHTITNSFSLDYGLMDNVTLSGTLPFVSKFTQGSVYSGISNGVGDLTFGARYQPFVQSPSGPSFTLTSQVNLPTGRSPFKTIEGSSLSTGSGYASATIGVNASQVLDPVALFGSLNFTVPKSIDNLNQYQSDGSTLLALRPGKSLGFGAGFTYALSYNVSTSVSFQETVTTNSHVTYLASGDTAPTTRATTMQVAAILNFGLGVRLSPKTTVNLTAGIGMTTDSPDFNLGLNVPLTFSMF